jgi:four helix bundle protein
MMESEQLRKRTKEFAHRCIKVAMALPDTPLGRHTRGQLIRCSTSAASNYRAACIAQSRASFVSKISIVLEEADESYFWLEFIIDERLLKKDLVEPLLKEAAELTCIFVASRKTARGKRTNSLINNQ